MRDIESLGEKIKQVILKTHGSTVLVLAAHLEELVAKIIQASMPNLTSAKKTEELFEGFGPLASFSSKIEIAYAFGFISSKDRSALRAIKCIRNDFAHSSDHKMDLGHPRLAKSLAMLPLPKEPKADNRAHLMEVYQGLLRSLGDELKRLEATKTNPSKAGD